MKSCFAILVYSALLSPVHSEPKQPPALSVSIHRDLGSKPDVIAAVWADGTIVWSKDPKNGGPPYLTAKIDPAGTAAFLTRMEKDGVFKKTADDLVHWGPDASYHRIELVHGKQHVYLESWHELYERSPKVVATSHGLSTLGDDETREQVLRRDQPSYRAFRKLWQEIRDFTARLIPDKGEPHDGDLGWEFPGE